MDRKCFAVLAGLILATRLVALADDKQPQKVQGWGQIVDPKTDCKFAEAKGTLSITVPGTHHNLNPRSGWENMDAPRVLQDVDGDFSVQARVRKFELPKPNTSSNKLKPNSYVASGVVVWQDDKNYLRFERGGAATSVFTVVEFYSNGELIATTRGPTIPNADTILRVERKQGKLKLFQSSDGKIWFIVQPRGKELTLEPKLKAGVFALNSTTRPITHEFADLKVIPPTAK